MRKTASDYEVIAAYFQRLNIRIISCCLLELNFTILVIFILGTLNISMNYVITILHAINLSKLKGRFHSNTG